MKGRILFFLIGLLPFLLPVFSYSSDQVYRTKNVSCVEVTYSYIQSAYGLPFIFGSETLAIGTFENVPIGKTRKDYSPGTKLYLCDSSGGSGKTCSFNKTKNKYDWYTFSLGVSSSSLIDGNYKDYLSTLPEWNESIPCNPPSPDSCPDSDGDGLCDPCDQWPDDPSVGSEWYLKGYLKYKGQIVGSYGSPSKNNSDYDRFSVADEYAEPDGFPGLGMFVGVAPGSGSGFYVDQDIFQKAGGETVFLSDPPLMFKTSCSPIDDITQCSDAICQDDAVPQVEKEDYPLNNSEIPAEEPYIDLDKPYYKPIPKPNPNDPPSTDPCPEHRALCSNTCGGSRKVSNFACAGTGGNSHVICSCDSAGGYELAPGFSDIGDLSFSTATSTGDSSTTSTFGSGTGKDYDPDSVGSGTDDLNQDGDPTNDSYSYEEGQVDFSPVQAAYGRLTGKFPFNLANSFVDVFRPFANAQGSTPTFTYEVVGHVVRFDLSPFNDFARFVRSMFALGLTLSTILALLYIYVGIDLRKK